MKLIHLDGRKFDISGPDGNAFVILGNVQKWLRQAGVPRSAIDEWHKEATSGDYENLLKVTTEATGIEFVDGKSGTEWLN